MKKLIVSFLFALGLVSCSNEVPEPDTPEVVSNTSRLLSLDGPDAHYDLEYDDMGRVLRAELLDGIRTYYAEYKYDKDHIYISCRWNDSQHGNVLKEDTVFLVDGRADSCAGKFLTDYRIRNKMEAERFYVKIRYNERGEMIYSWSEDVWPYYLSPSSSPKIQIYYWWTTYEWKDGNIVKTASDSNKKNDGYPYSQSYSYSSLPGNNVLMEARYVRPEYYALVENGYFGVACKNLMESFEDDDGFGLKYDYELDSQKRVVTIKEIRTYESYGYFRVEAYNLKWSNAVNGQ